MKRPKFRDHKYFKLFDSELKSWIEIFTVSFTIFVLFVTITSWLSHVFGWHLLPIFNNTLYGFRNFTHYLLDEFIYSPLLYLLSYSVYAITFALSKISGIVPFLPSFHIPPWLRDCGIVSLILLRSQKRAMKLSAPVSLHAMTKLEQSEWKETIKSSPTSLKLLIDTSWGVVMLIYRTTKFVTYPLRFIRFDFLRHMGDLFVGGSLMLGIAYFIHDLFITISTRSLYSQVAIAHRRFMLWMTICLLVALIASLVFLAVNGFLIDEH